MRYAVVVATATVLMLVDACGGHRPASAPQPSAFVTGPVVTDWGTAGTVTLPDVKVSQLLEDTQGRMLVIGIFKESRAYVARLLPDGSPDPSFGSGGAVLSPYSRGLGWLMGAVLPSGRIALAGTTPFGVVDDRSSLVVTVLDRAGHPDHAFGHDGYVTMGGKTCVRGPAGIATNGDRIVVGAIRSCTPTSVGSPLVIEFRPNGTTDRGFGDGGSVTLPAPARYSGYTTPMAHLPDGRLMIATGGARGGLILLYRLRPDGKPDQSFGALGVASARVAVDSSVVHVYALFQAKLGRYTVTGCTPAGPFLARFNRDGSPYRFWGGGPNNTSVNVENFGGAFGSPCAAIAQLPSYRLVAAGGALLRLNRSGVLDPYHPLASLPGPHGATILPAPRHVLLAASDGTVLVTSYLVKTAAKKKTLITRYH